MYDGTKALGPMVNALNESLHPTPSTKYGHASHASNIPRENLKMHLESMPPKTTCSTQACMELITTLLIHMSAYGVSHPASDFISENSNLLVTTHPRSEEELVDVSGEHG